MQLCKFRLDNGAIRVGLVEGSAVRVLDLARSPGVQSLSDILYTAEPAKVAQGLLDRSASPIPLQDVQLLAPIDDQEVWAAGVTYKRSQEARERESAGAARFYDLVYSAPRPELFFKATATRVVGPGQPVRVRRDSTWSVPEPEVALVISPELRVVGFTIGNDMSARDIEGENPLYLPQAKVYDQSCAVGPVITLAGDLPASEHVTIRLAIERHGGTVFEGSALLSQMGRSFEELVRWLGRDNSFPHGAVLLTGTCIVPPDDFTLARGDRVSIDITGIGRLTNPVERAPGD
jgi:2-dehydro-3-deoxy-D-arabinonate dehydratase